MKKTVVFFCLRLEVLKRAEGNRPFSDGKKFGQNEEFTLEKYFLANCLAIFLLCFQSSSTKRYEVNMNASESYNEYFCVSLAAVIARKSK